MVQDPVEVADKLLEDAFHDYEKKEADRERLAAHLVKQYNITPRQAFESIEHHENNLRYSATMNNVTVAHFVKNAPPVLRWTMMGISIGYIITKDHYNAHLDES